jgi:hypothetical protein
MLQDDRLSDYERIALHGAQQALRNILEPDTWHPASQTFYRIDNRPIIDRSHFANAFITRVMAGCFGFFTFTQFGDVPAR